MLNLTNLRAAYGESEVLHGLNLNVQPGEIVAIMGRNGMGKTTLMKTMMGIVPTSNGSVTVGGTDVTAMKSHKRVANGIAYVPQGRMIFSAMTVQENVETGLTVTGKKSVPTDIYELFPTDCYEDCDMDASDASTCPLCFWCKRAPRIPNRWMWTYP